MAYVAVIVEFEIFMDLLVEECLPQVSMAEIMTFIVAIYIIFIP